MCNHVLEVGLLMRRHFGDLGAVISKRKTTQYSYSYARHPEIVDPVPEARRGEGGGGEGGGGGGGGGGDSSAYVARPLPPPLPPPRVYKQQKSL